MGTTSLQTEAFFLPAVAKDPPLHSGQSLVTPCQPSREMPSPPVSDGRTEEAAAASERAGRAARDSRGTHIPSTLAKVGASWWADAGVVNTRGETFSSLEQSQEIMKLFVQVSGRFLTQKVRQRQMADTHVSLLRLLLQSGLFKHDLMQTTDSETPIDVKEDPSRPP